ncbi:MAG: aminotransferase class I/II-fold pyridoxal phosphate-dependent enzyme, partial [Phaeodactylibacter sp.]|nr:aminotransferase class I/II-fold pyridoxal phosphate-dependent enzyme [Phaeodactylibacter sp.]
MTTPVANTEMIIQPAQRLGEVKEYYFSTKLREIAQMRADGKYVLNLGIGSPDLPPSQEVIETLTNAVLHNDMHGYQSYTGIPELRAAFADWYKTWFGATLD